MTFMLSALVAGAIAIALGLAAAAAARRQSAATRHAVLTAAIASALVMPLLKLLVPELPLVQWGSAGSAVSSGLTLLSGDVLSGSSIDGTAAAASSVVSWAALAAAVWIGGVICMSAVLSISLIRLARFRRHCSRVDGRWRALTDDIARAAGIRRPVTLLESSDASVLIACGLFRPAIILPPGTSGWTEDRIRAVLRHELAHIRRHDAAAQLAGEALRIFHWFNPLVWAVCRRLRHESELACDDEVLNDGIEATTYATQLLDIAKHLSGRRPAWAAAQAIAHPSTLERRIAAMLHHHRNRAHAGRRAWLVTSLAALAVSLPLAAASVAPADVAPLVAPASHDVTLAAPSASPHSDPAAHAVPAPRRQATGTIGGTLLDQSGATLPGATVTLANIETGTQSVTATDAAGRFAFRGLQPATYHVAASLPGFKSGTIDVRLTPGETIAPTLKLALGSVHETIHVTCGQTSGVVRLLELSARMGEALLPRLYAQGMPAVRVGGTLRPPLKLADARPVCPSTIPSAETTIHIVGHIGVNGLIEDGAPAPGASGSEPPAELTQSALDAIRRWSFSPTLLNGQAVETEIAIDVTFGKS